MIFASEHGFLQEYFPIFDAWPFHVMVGERQT